jgi:hypothetical protein
MDEVKSTREYKENPDKNKENPDKNKDFCLYQNIQTVCGAHPTTKST